MNAAIAEVRCAHGNVLRDAAGSRETPCECRKVVPRAPAAPCPIGKSQRHRWIDVAGKAREHRQCKHCGATARVDAQGRTVFVEGVPLNRLEANSRMDLE